MLGDEGSGHAISIDLLRAVMNAVDESGPPTILVEAVLNKLNLNKPEELIGWAYNEKDTTWQRIASLSSLVYECANKGDQVSIAIIQHAADCLLVRFQLNFSFLKIHTKILSILKQRKLLLLW